MSKITTHQLREFQDLIEKVFQCCQDRIQYQSKKFNLPDAEQRNCSKNESGKEPGF